MMLALTAVCLIVLLFFSGFFSGMETAILSVSRAKIRNLADKGSRRAGIILKYLDHPDEFVSTVLVGNNIVNTSLSVLATWFFLSLFHDPSRAVAYTMLVLTPLVLIFGEILPKTLGRQCPHAFTLKLAPYFQFVYTFLLPVARWVLKIIHLIIPQRKRDVVLDTLVRRQEIQALVREGERLGIVEDDEKEMIESVFELAETAVDEIMVPRVSMSAISDNLTYDEVVAIVLRQSFTRYPVYHETPDRIVGILHVADLLIGGTFDLNKITPPFYQPDSARLDDALESLRKEGQNMAIVVDEYGGTAGLVTIEDLLEELVGEIKDEFDGEESEIVATSPRCWSVRGYADLDDLVDELNFEVDESVEAETIGGMVTEIMGRIPRPGEEVRIGRFLILVTEANDRHVVNVEIRDLSSSGRAEALKNENRGA